MRHSRFTPFLLAVLCLTQACAVVSSAKRPAEKTPALDTRQLVILPIDVALTGADVTTLGSRRAEVARELQAALAPALGNRSLGTEPEKGIEVVRIRNALKSSPPLVYRAGNGAPEKPRPRLAEGEVRALAEASNADTLLVVHLNGDDTSTSAQVAQSATRIATAALAGAVMLSPTRVLLSATKIGEISHASELRVALVDGATGEILWANYARIKRAPTAEVIGDLVAQAFETFPPTPAAYASR